MCILASQSGRCIKKLKNIPGLVECDHLESLGIFYLMGKREGCIYKITSPTGRIYIGQSYNVKDRIYRYSKAKCTKQPKIYHSIKKYGWDNHKFEIVAFGLFEPIFLNQLECDFIDAYDCLGYGLNCSSGGNLNSRHSKETILKMRLSAKGKRSPEHIEAIRLQNKNRVFTDEMRAKMSKSRTGMKLSETHRKNISLNAPRNMSKLVLDMNTGVFFNSGKEASDAYNMNSRTLKNMLNGNKRNKTSLKYVE